jgi:hypothetical protein
MIHNAIDPNVGIKTGQPSKSKDLTKSTLQGLDAEWIVL